MEMTSTVFFDICELELYNGVIRNINNEITGIF
jgi:hypothetical protein